MDTTPYTGTYLYNNYIDAYSPYPGKLGRCNYVSRPTMGQVQIISTLFLLLIDFCSTRHSAYANSFPPARKSRPEPQGAI